MEFSHRYRGLYKGFRIEGFGFWGARVEVHVCFGFTVLGISEFKDFSFVCLHCFGFRVWDSGFLFEGVGFMGLGLAVLYSAFEVKIGHYGRSRCHAIRFTVRNLHTFWGIEYPRVWFRVLGFKVKG